MDDRQPLRRAIEIPLGSAAACRNLHPVRIVDRRHIHDGLRALQRIDIAFEATRITVESKAAYRAAGVLGIRAANALDGATAGIGFFRVLDRKSVVLGTCWSLRLSLGGRSILHK